MRIYLLAAAATLAVVGTASATIVSGTTATPGTAFVKLGVPFFESEPDNTVGNNNFQSPNLFGFDEDQNVALVGDLDVDLLAATNAPGTLAAGSTVASHYIFFDPIDDPESTIDGTVTFDSAIVAVIFSTDTLGASDYLANTGVTYLEPSLRGLEGGDLVEFIDAFTIRFNTTASTPGDYIRVLTDFSPSAEVPTPATLALLGLGLVGLGLRRAR